MGDNDDPRPQPRKERRKEIVVVDRPTEVGVKINNVLTALVLMVMSWVGYNIDSMRTQISEVNTSLKLQKQGHDYLKDRFDRHLEDHKERRFDLHD